MKFEVMSNIVKEKLKFELLGIRQSFLSAKKIARKLSKMSWGLERFSSYFRTFFILQS